MVAGKSQFNESDTSTVARENRSQMIDFVRSDGNPANRPDQLERIVRGGEVNYHRKVHINEPASASWRQKVGTALAKDLGLTTSKVWYLSGWPKDYEFFVHLKGPADAPRHDLYLFGGPSKFRSSNEFYPHARWLLQDETLNPANCSCKYCGNVKMQRQINFREGLGPPVVSAPVTPHEKTTNASSGSINRSYPRRAAASKYGRAASLPLSLRFNPVNTYLETDLRSKRPFRLGEIVWVHLNPPIICESLPESKIDWWPAVVQEPRTKSETVGAHIPGKPFTVQQRNVYRVLMLSVRAQYVLHEEQILPYLAYAPPTSLIEHLENMLASETTIPSFVHNKSEHSPFPPLPDPLRASGDIFLEPMAIPPRTFENALFPFLMAYRMSHYMTTYWCATDEWVFESEATRDQASIKQRRYQGVWWGPERIWLGDVVRIKPRRTLLQGDLLPPSPGAEERALLLKVEAIYLEPAEEGDDSAEGGMMVSGTLYEVADKNFGVPEQPPVASTSTAPPPKPKPDAKPVDPTDPTLPPPPSGYKFRPITPSADLDAHFDIHQLAGRYYPGLLQVPVLASALTITNFKPDALGHHLLPEFPPRLTALVGAVAGASNAIEPTRYKESRTPMLIASKEDASKEFPLSSTESDVEMRDAAPGSDDPFMGEMSTGRELFGQRVFT